MINSTGHANFSSDLDSTGVLRAINAAIVVVVCLEDVDMRMETDPPSRHALAERIERVAIMNKVSLLYLSFRPEMKISSKPSLLPSVQVNAVLCDVQAYQARVNARSIACAFLFVAFGSRFIQPSGEVVN